MSFSFPERKISPARPWTERRTSRGGEEGPRAEGTVKKDRIIGQDRTEEILHCKGIEGGLLLKLIVRICKVLTYVSR